MVFPVPGLNLEIEVKMKIGSIEVMEKRLITNGAKYCCNLVHEDHYFDTPPVMDSFRKTDEALRVRISRNETDGTEQTHLTFKGKKIDATTKSREEINLQVSDGTKIREILKKLSFQEVIVIRKERVVYSKGDISITLDEVQFLDDAYMELEIIADEDMVESTRERLFSFMKALGFHRDDSERRSYLELVLERLAERH
ncbi:class IV adenylate cyclase [Candidatus Bathyarchaeota archaeon]|nr:class IV adenylate cyclase [Candidatus Bathyarchaeota archaeon]